MPHKICQDLSFIVPLFLQLIYLFTVTYIGGKDTNELGVQSLRLFRTDQWRGRNHGQK